MPLLVLILLRHWSTSLRSHVRYIANGSSSFSCEKDFERQVVILYCGINNSLVMEENQADNGLDEHGLLDDPP